MHFIWFMKFEEQNRIVWQKEKIFVSLFIVICENILVLIVINYLLSTHEKVSITTHQICNLIGVPSRLMIFCLKSIPADTFIIYI